MKSVLINKIHFVAIAILLLSVNSLFAQIIFDTPVNYAVGSQPYSVFSIDFNGDNNNDLVTANASSNNVSILLGNGDGTFQSAVNYSVGVYPRSVFSIDFNDDGNYDLVTANGTSDNVSILLGNGDGTFQVAVNYLVGNNPHSVFSINFNGDNYNDLVTANLGSNDASVLIGNGDGTFQPAVNYATGATPHSVFSNDFNSDGVNDLLIANRGSNNLSLLLGYGDGTFQNAVVSVTYGTDAKLTSVFSMDFNGDGYNDIVSSNELPDNVSIALGNGNGTFKPAVSYAAGDYPYTVFSNDFNNDGNNDLVTANINSDNVSILIGNGDGTFQSTVYYTAGDGPISVFSIDCNNDGKNDLVTANVNSNNLSILLNISPPFIQNIFIENDTLNLHVLNHTPEISWSFADTTTQTEFEIAIGTDNDWAFAEMWNPAPITSPDTFITYNGSPLIDSETYYGRLKVSNGTAWSEWFEFSFRMNSKPTTPVTLSPQNDTITNSTPTLWIQNSVDAEFDSLFYDFSGNKDTETGVVYEPLLTGNEIVAGVDSTGLIVPSPLEENMLYFWEVRAYDGYEYSDWTTLLSTRFWVNEINEAPSASVAIQPNETSSPLYNLQPTLNWTESFDADPFDTVHYKLHIAIDSNFTFETLIDSIQQNSYTLTFPLEYNEHYWWKVEAVDIQGLATESNIQHFWTTCCVGIRGNVNSDALELVDISDLVYLVAYMFQGGFPYSCEDEADINGSGGATPIDVSDLVMLVAYMFQGGDAPADCP